MAKQQQLSLNPSKLSGQCGRLKCCLRYELPNGEGVKHAGCADHGGCSNPTGCGNCGAEGGCGSCGHHVAAFTVRRDGARSVDPSLDSGPSFSDKPRIGITVGDPAGIGPEIAVKAAADPRVLEVCEPRALRAARRRRRSRAFPPGQLSAEAGRAAYDAIVAAVRRRAGGHDRRDRDGADQQGSVRARRACRGRGTPICSAHLTGTPRVAMMFYAEELRVVLATMHVPLRRRAARCSRASSSTSSST